LAFTAQAVSEKVRQSQEVLRQELSVLCRQIEEGEREAMGIVNKLSLLDDGEIKAFVASCLKGLLERKKALQEREQEVGKELSCLEEKNFDLCNTLLSHTRDILENKKNR
jgi:hypothetical protein